MKSMLLLVGAGLLATAIGWLGSSLQNHFQLPEELQNVGGNIAGETVAKLELAMAEAKRKNMALVFAVYGAGLCSAAALAAGLATRGRPLTGLLAGAVLGGVVGAATGPLNLFLFNRMRDADSDSFVTTKLAHGTMWILIGLAFSAAVRMASRRKVLGQLALVGLLCGGIAAAVYPFICAMAFPLANVELPIPTGTGALITWFALPSLLYTIGAGRMLSHQPQSADAASQEESTASVGTA